MSPAVGGDPTIVVRWSSLGDVVLAGSVTGALAPVVFVTKAPWAPIARRLPGVVEVRVWPRDPLPERGRVIDLHHDLRSVWLTRGRDVSRVRRHDFARRMRIWRKGPPAPRVVDRYARAARVERPALQWFSHGPPNGSLVLVPGAHWATKRWLDERWMALGAGWAGPVVVCGGPSDRARVNAIARGVGPRAVPLAEDGFDHTFDAMSCASVVVAGDTGLMHLAGAMAVPLVALFGPTTSKDGFWCHTGEVVEVPMDCRPCSRFGTARCPQGHHRCMSGIPVSAVEAAVARVRR